MIVKILPNVNGSPNGKLADVEVHFTGEVLAGLRLLGFAIWNGKAGGRTVTFPSRTYSVHGERRSYQLLRPIGDQRGQEAVRDLILRAYEEFEGKAEAAT